MHGIDQIFVINLKRRPDRLQNFKQNLNRSAPTLNIEDDIIVFNAHDGQDIMPTEDIMHIARNNDFNYAPNVLGCALSHYDIWKWIAGSNSIYRALVFEDDVNFITTDFVKDWNELFKQLPDRCDLLYLNIANNEHEIEVIQHNNTPFSDTFSGGYSTYAYVITQKMAQTYVRYIEDNGISRAIDGVMFDFFVGHKIIMEHVRTHDRDGCKAYRLLQPLTTHISGNGFDSDIAQHLPSLKTKNIVYRKSISVAFVGFWPQYNVQTNYFTQLIQRYFGIKVNIDNNNPELIICSVFCDYKFIPNIEQVKHVPKIIFTGENFSVNNLGYDLSIGFDYEDNIEDNNYIRVPLWFFMIDWFRIRDPKIMGDPDLVPIEWLNRNGPAKYRDKFCLFVSGDDKCQHRNLLVQHINQYKPVDSGGPLYNNISMPGDNEDSNDRMRRYTNKIEFSRQYRYALVAENESSPGYCTEKLLHAFAGGCVPIYWGDPTATIDFNPKAFIDANGKSISEVIQIIDNIESTPGMWNDMASESVFNSHECLLRYRSKIVNRLKKIRISVV